MVEEEQEKDGVCPDDRNPRPRERAPRAGREGEPEHRAGVSPGEQAKSDQGERDGGVLGRAGSPLDGGGCPRPAARGDAGGIVLSSFGRGAGAPPGVPEVKAEQDGDDSMVEESGQTRA